MVCILLEPRLAKLAQAARMETRGQNDAGAETEMGENGETEVRTQARTSKIRSWATLARENWQPDSLKTGCGKLSKPAKASREWRP